MLLLLWAVGWQIPGIVPLRHPLRHWDRWDWQTCTVAHCDSCKVNVIMPRNVIWDYFTKSKTDVSKAKCMECLKLLSLGSDKPGKQTVHGLKCHLEKAHKELFAEYTTKLNASKERRRKNLSWTNTRLRSRNSSSSHCQTRANDPLNGQTTTRLYSALTKPSWT